MGGAHDAHLEGAIAPLKPALGDAPEGEQYHQISPLQFAKYYVSI